MQKGFTLIELLIVIAVLAVLSAAVVLVLNPAELLKQSRDSTRISDLAAVNSALALWTADVGQSSSWPSATSTCTWNAVNNTGTGNGVFPMAASTTVACAVSSSTVTSGSGWIPINLGLISGGAPLSKLPIDPNNGSANCLSVTTGNFCYYGFKSSTTVGQYKLVANMESVKYSQNGTADVESNNKDGGVVSDWYELGSNMTP